MKNPKSILITGGSSGIGEALAIDYAAPDVTLFLSGRDAQRLGAVKETCVEKGADVHIKIIDCAERDAMHSWIAECDEIRPLDLVIANAGIGKSFLKHHDLDRHTREIFAVNVDGVFNTLHPALAYMYTRKSGQIAIMASLAGYHGMPTAPAYSTSKACVKAYGESLRGLYAADGVKVNVICPGFIKSRMTAVNDFKMPFLMDSDKAVRIIRNGLEKNKARIAFPWQMTLIFGFLTRFLPESMLDRFLRQLPDK